MSKYNKKVVFLLTILSFSFYLGVGSNFQFYQLIFYPLTILMVVANLIKKRSIQKTLGSVFLLLVMILIFFILTTIINKGTISDLLVAFKSIGEPAMVISLFMFVRQDEEYCQNIDILSWFSKCLIIMLCINATWAFVSMIGDVTFINLYFWGGEDSVALRALTNGRYSGIFNQPMESGTIYSIGLFCWYYLVKLKKQIKMNDLVKLIFLFFGGILSVSKVFLFVGAPLFLLAMLTNKTFYRYFIKVLSWSIATIFLVMQLLVIWKGGNYLARFWAPGQNLASLLTAGRFGEDSQLVTLFKSVSEHNLFIGGGYGFSDVYDSLYFYFFSIGGIIGLAFLLILLLTFYKQISSQYKKKGSEYIVFLLLFCLIVAGGVGAPILTLNRVNILVWIMIAIIYKQAYLNNRLYFGMN
ncbi:hypothetical protein LQF59_00815 [Tetragenococcus koreensis]|uniref:hypothetical protein n=1 Tax=Tetragenococcus koreensis TaxID=290335 RepID=UPI001F32EF00|nr:hypothetical protein [Tetragenococcus koreensis]MCF1613602.1 hypothetical protein [Tetragenococcus koreensis]MCF1623402.1 hypothetical protein [Tetragenococcus koreensis]